MAQTAKSRKKTSSNGRTASQKTEKYRFAENVDGDGTVAEREYRRYASEGGEEMGEEPDVLLDVPVVKVDSIHLEVDDLDAHVALQAKVLDLVNLNVGVDVHLGKVQLDIKGVEAQALVKVRLDYVAAIVDRVLTTIDRNPELVENLGQAVEDIGSGAGQMLDDTGEAVEEVGEGADEAVGEIGEGAGQAVGDVGEGAGEAVEDVGEGAGQAVGELGQAAREAAGAGPGVRAKGAAKAMVKEAGNAVTDEAKGLRTAAARKATELGDKRRHRRAEKHNATDAAVSAAEELGVDLGDVEGSGAEGRITVRDVHQAATDDE